MRIALITPTVVTQPSTGYRTRLFQTQALLRRVASDQVVAWDISRRMVIDLGQTHLPVEEQSTAGSSGQGQALHTLYNLAAAALHFWPGFTVQSLRATKQQILAWIDDYRPDAVVLVHPYATELIPSLRIRTKLICVETQNVESDLVRQLMLIEPSFSRRIELFVRWKTLERWERWLFPLAHDIWMPSQEDVIRQKKISGGMARIRLVPNGLDVTAYQVRQSYGSNDIVLAAYFAHSPNIVGAQVLRDQVLGKVREVIPDARLVLVGRDPTGAARALVNGPEIIATGEVPDTRPYLERAGVVAVPIFQGGGTRYKILEALAMGLPVVTTPLGCEGLEVRDGEHLLVRESDGFAAAIIALLRDPATGQQLGRCGRTLVETHYSWNSIEQSLRPAFAQVPVRI